MKLNKEQFDELLKLLNSKKYNDLDIKINQLMETNPNSYLLYNLYGAYKKITGNFKVAEESFKRSIEINKNFFDGYNNLGLLYAEQNNFIDSITYFENAIKLNPKNPFFYNNLGNSYAQINKYDEAIKNFKLALSCDHNFFLSHNNIGLVQYKLKKFKESIESFKKSININDQFAEGYLNIGNSYFEIGLINLALKSITTSIKINPKFAKAYNNLGNILRDQNLHFEAIKNYKEAIKINPNFAEIYNNLGNTLSDINQIDDAIEALQKAIELDDKYYQAYNNLGNLYSKKKDILLAINCYEKASSINKNFSSALASSIFHKMNLCDWSAIEDFLKNKDTLGIVGEEITPFYTLAMEDNPRNQLLRSINYSKKKLEKFSQQNQNLKLYENKKIKIGYYSSDFYDHATMYLISGLLREHDKDEFEIIVFNYGKNKSTEFVNSIMKNVDLYKDVSNVPDLEIVKLSRELKIDIAIDLKGHTLNSKTKLFAYRMAPIQINYLGYPGSLGTSFIDYIIADKILIPDSESKHYSEKIIYLPNSYQPNDNQREISKIETKKEDFDFPENSLILSCLNSTYKITPDELEIWSRILEKTNNTYLWLLDTNKQGKNNLINFFKNKNIDIKRIKFAENLSHSCHLERLRHSDVFLDTFNVNAHTTCSDALWVGVPVVTKQGKQFSARVASSLLNALNLNELITKNKDEYEKLILKLVNDKKKLIDLKNKIKQNIKNEALFNTKQYVKHYEIALKKAYENKKKNIEITNIN